MTERIVRDQQANYRAWAADQLAKSHFFREKLHDWEISNSDYGNIVVGAGAAATILSLYHDLTSAALALVGDYGGARRRGDKRVCFAQGNTAPSRPYHNWNCCWEMMRVAEAIDAVQGGRNPGTR